MTGPAAVAEHRPLKRATQGERVLGLCHLKLDPATYSRTYQFETDPLNFPLTGLCFVGLVALQDPRAAENIFGVGVLVVVVCVVMGGGG